MKIGKTLIQLILISTLCCQFVAVAPAAQSIRVLPNLPVAVAPNQPEVTGESTAGIINALCDVTLNIVGCGFTPTSATVICDTNGDGTPELIVTLDRLTVVNRLLLQARLPVLSPELPGTAFPLACCGGGATLQLTRMIASGDDNVFGAITQTVDVQIDLDLRAPVVISASPSDVDCSIPQNIMIPGSCFLQPDGSPNVTSVFAVERDNANNVVAASSFVILSNNLIDALFNFGSPNAGKTFLIFASGPNGTSRNLTSLPDGAPDGCPLGNEQGVEVTVSCRSAAPPTPTDGPITPTSAVINGCKVTRSATGKFSLAITGRGFKPGAVVLMP
ncbi:MAG TPA: hypothetical protein VJQ56_12245, partial [Blastocatellia bacterium]|nr:hypothetical protein [Blastocatellia bacterium]